MYALHSQLPKRDSSGTLASASKSPGLSYLFLALSLHLEETFHFFSWCLSMHYLGGHNALHSSTFAFSKFILWFFLFMVDSAHPNLR